MQTNLTTHNTPRKIEPTRTNYELGRGNPFLQGDRTPQFKAVFLCLSFRKLFPFHIMMALFGQPSRLVVPCSDISTPFNAVANAVESFGVGNSYYLQGITA